MGAVTLVMLLPLVFSMTFLSVQAGLWFHARHVVIAAAQEGARAARGVDLDPAQAQAAGEQRAAAFAAGVSGTVTTTGITVQRGDEQVTVVVTGHAPAILPGFDLEVSGRSTSPVERFVAP